MDDFGRQFSQYVKKVEAALQPFPRIAANIGHNFFLDRFRQQNWVGNTTEPWKPRKAGSKRNSGRAILTDSGRLKRSIRVIRASWNAGVAVGTDEPYAAAHNKGLRKTVRVGEHSRVASRKIATRYSKSGRALKTGIKRIRGAGHQVKSHNRKMNLPKRQFIGDSPVLNNLIQREFKRLLSKI